MALSELELGIMTAQWSAAHIRPIKPSDDQSTPCAAQRDAVQQLLLVETDHFHGGVD
jgi:hypothetical protein